MTLSPSTHREISEPHAPAQTAHRLAGRRGANVKTLLLAVLIALGDVLVWQAAPGLNLAVLGLAAVLAGLILAWPRLTAPRHRIGIALGGVVAVLPLVELVQPLSALIAWVGLCMICVVLAGLGPRDVLRGVMRLWWVAPAQVGRDVGGAVQRMGAVTVAQRDIRSILTGWTVPIGLTALFALLLIGANPVLDQSITDLFSWSPPAVNTDRIWLWLGLALVLWPWLVTGRMRARLAFRRPARITVKRPGLVNGASVARSLVAFNALFAVQTAMDVLFLYGDVALPEGISPAAYAHRGAYPLLVTALLAGAIAVLARPHLAGRPVLRWLMMLWLAQTLALVFASVWRLDIYVDAFGLTRLRLVAYVWMGVVAIGLGITAQQIWEDRDAAWMLVRSAALGAVTLYVCAFVNFDGAVARHNLTSDVPEDRRLLCQLSEGAMPAIERLSGQTTGDYCSAYYLVPDVSQPADWREWGFRNWRVRRSLAAIATQATGTAER